MRSILFALAMSLGILLPAMAALAEPPADRDLDQLRSEIAETQALIAKWTAHLKMLEQRLAKAQQQERSEYLRFPSDIERAMMGEAEVRASRLNWPSPSGELFPRVEPQRK